MLVLHVDWYEYDDNELHCAYIWKLNSTYCFGSKPIIFVILKEQSIEQIHPSMRQTPHWIFRYPSDFENMMRKMMSLGTHPIWSIRLLPETCMGYLSNDQTKIIRAINLTYAICLVLASQYKHADCNCLTKTGLTFIPFFFKSYPVNCLTGLPNYDPTHFTLPPDRGP